MTDGTLLSLSVLDALTVALTAYVLFSIL